MLPKVVKNLRIDLNLGQVRKSIAINQNSSLAPTLNLYLVDAGSPVSLDDLLYAEIFIHKADNHEAINGCVIDGDSIQYTLHSTDVSAVGINEAQLQLTWKDGSVAVTPTFEIVVYQAVVDESVQTSMNEYTSLSQMLVQANDYKDAAADSAENAADSATAAAASAEAAAGSAEDAADSAEEAESYALAAGRDADRSATNASIALTAEAWATGQTNGLDVPDTEPQYHNNSKYYASLAGESADSAAASASETADDVETAGSLYTATSEAASEGAAYYASNTAIASEIAVHASETADDVTSTSTFESLASSEAASASQYAAVASSEAVVGSTYAATASSEAAVATSQASQAASEVASASEYASVAASETAAGSTYAANASSCQTATSEYTSTAGSLATATSEYNSSASEYASYAHSEAVVAGDYADAAQQAAQSISGALRPMGTVTFANLPLLVDADVGDMYNVSDAFTTTSDFKEGGDKKVAAGSNVYKTADGKWDVLAGSFSFDRMNDVDVSGIQDGDIIKYSAFSSKWENKHCYINSATVVPVLTDTPQDVTFTNIPTSGDYLIDFFTSTGINYMAIDTSVSGQVTITFPHPSQTFTVYCVITEV